MTDECPECGSDHWDLQALIFAQMASPPVGRVAIQYRRVACAPPKDMELHIDSNRGAGGWMRLFVSDVANLGTVRAVSIGSEGSWYNLNNIWGAAWELGWTPAPPLDLRITDEGGKMLVARQVITVSGQVGVMPLGVQFSVEGANTATSSLDVTPSANTTTSAGNTTTSMPAPKAAPAPPTATSSGGCVDVPVPESLFSCAQQQQWGKVCVVVREALVTHRCNNRPSSAPNRGWLRQPPTPPTAIARKRVAAVAPAPTRAARRW